MPFTIADGILGLEGQHTWNGLVTLNGTGYRLIDIAGIHSGADREDPRTPRVGRIGENDYPTSPLGKTIVYTGELEDDASVVAMLQLGQRLRAAFAGAAVRGTMVVTPYSGDPNADGSSPTWQYTAKTLQPVDVPDTWERLRWSRKFTIGLRLSDPRYYLPGHAVDVTGSPAVVTNVGGAPADPLLTVAGASGNVTVSDGTRTLAFRNVPSGTLTIDFAARTAKVGSTHCELVVATSNWWDSFVDGIAAGATESIGVTGGSSVRVRFTPSSW